MLHLATLLAVIIYFYKDISEIFKGMIRCLFQKDKFNLQLKLILYIIIATIPTALIGFFFRDFFESIFLKPKIVGGMLLITGGILFSTKFFRREKKDLNRMRWMDSFYIGIVQGLAIIPGISRSGATISTGIFLGLNRELSGKFSFLISIPAILGATILEFYKLNSIKEGLNPTTAIGMLFAFGFGMLALRILMRWIKAGKLHNFSFYCWFIGIMTIIL
jgi:undecaprenyl-diphosphatase